MLQLQLYIYIYICWINEIATVRVVYMLNQRNCWCTKDFWGLSSWVKRAASPRRKSLAHSQWSRHLSTSWEIIGKAKAQELFTAWLIPSFQPLDRLSFRPSYYFRTDEVFHYFFGDRWARRSAGGAAKNWSRTKINLPFQRETYPTPGRIHQLADHSIRNYLFPFPSILQCE